LLSGIIVCISACSAFGICEFPEDFFADTVFEEEEFQNPLMELALVPMGERCRGVFWDWTFWGDWSFLRDSEKQKKDRSQISGAEELEGCSSPEGCSP